ncbi:transposase [Effusibacillus pohliae]|uniref:transposase n=1 Tax=Effusibacillus pohliae TaxID=232270 RepID=UPI00036D49A6|nr:transposase [Effusibacillus pohliae]
MSEWIPEDHLARPLSDIVDQLDLSAIISRHSNRVEEAYHPALLSKLWFYGYATGAFTSRKIRTAIDENIPFHWLCGGHRPGFRTISDFRKENIELLLDLYTQVVQNAMNLGYVSLGHVSIDGSELKAHSSKHKAMSRERMKQEIQRMENEIREALQQAQQADEQEEGQLLLFPESVNAEVRDRQVRLAKIKEVLKQLEERKPEAESKTPEKD